MSIRRETVRGEINEYIQDSSAQLAYEPSISISGATYNINIPATKLALSFKYDKRARRSDNT